MPEDDDIIRRLEALRRKIPVIEKREPPETPVYCSNCKLFDAGWFMTPAAYWHCTKIKEIARTALNKRAVNYNYKSQNKNNDCEFYQEKSKKKGFIKTLVGMCRK